MHQFIYGHCKENEVLQDGNRQRVHLLPVQHMNGDALNLPGFLHRRERERGKKKKKNQSFKIVLVIIFSLTFLNYSDRNRLLVLVDIEELEEEWSSSAIEGGFKCVSF